MQIIDNTIKIQHNYLDISIRDKNYDDHDDMNVEIDIAFAVEVNNTGISVDVNTVKAVRWSYVGVKFTEGENDEQQVTGASDDSWDVQVHKEKTEKPNFGLTFADISIDLDNKKIDINFEC